MLDRILTLVMSLVLSAMSIGPASAQTRVVVRPAAEGLGRIESLRVQRTAILDSMRQQYAEFRALRNREEVLHKACNRQTAAEVAMLLGNKAWDKVAEKHGPLELRGAMKAEEWLEFVAIAFGRPSAVAEILGNNFKCRALVTEAYIGYHTRLQGLGITLKNVEADLAVADQALAGKQSYAPPATPAAKTLFSNSIDPELKWCDGFVARRCGAANTTEVSAEYYTCMGFDMKGRMRTRDLANLTAITVRLSEIEGFRCSRLRDPEEWVAVAKALRSGGY